MIKLTLGERPKNYLIRFIKRNNEDIWDIYIGDWFGGDPNFYQGAHLENKPKFPISMNADDLVKMAEEIKKGIRKKDSLGYNLDLTLHENKPKFCATLTFMDKKYHENWKDEIGKFRFGVGFNLKFSVWRNKSYDMQYLYEGKGKTSQLLEYYTKKELKKFADDLIKEAKK